MQVFGKHMHPYVILCLDDDAEILAQLERELAAFSSSFDIVCIDNVSSATVTLSELHQQGRQVALFICDHDLGEDNGVDLLINIDNQPASAGARTILLNDQAQIEVIMQAVNEGRLNYCMTKPWEPDQMIMTARKELTHYVLKHNADDLLKFCNVLDQRRLLDAHIENRLASYRHGFIESAIRTSDDELAQQLFNELTDYFDHNDENHAFRSYSEDHLLTHEGQPNSFLWFVVDGEVALLKRDETGASHEVARLGKGSLIGGMSFVTGDVSFSTGITLQPTNVIKLNRALFGKVMQARNDLLPLFTSYLLRHFNRRLKRSITTEVKLQQTLKSLELAHKQLIEREKMAMLGQLVAGVAHELNNPVSAILRNSDTLKDSIGELINTELNDTAKEQANQIMAEALLSRPMSTADARQRAKAIEPMIGDRTLARKAVNMGFDNPTDIRTWMNTLDTGFEKTLMQWDMFYQAGSLLRSTSVCAQRIADMVKSLKTYARQDDETMRDVDIHEGIEDTLVMFENQLKRLKVVRDYGDLRDVRCMPIALQQVWTNLVSNALDAVDSDGEIHVTTRETVYQSRKAVKVTVRDNGSGIPETIKNKIFELNYTTKREGHFGLGIGLSVCRQIVEHHGGKIEVASSSGEFTAMTVTLPYTPLFAASKEEK